MRRMRDFHWQYLLFIIPAIVAVLGIQYLNRKGTKAEHAPTVATGVKTIPVIQAQVVEEEDTSPEVVAEGTIEKTDTQIATATQAGSNLCKSVEFPGDGSLTQVSAKDWDMVIGHFHAVKQQLVSYIETHHDHLAKRTFDAMESRIKTLRIQRPPTAEEPDLAWRGIGVFVQDGSQLVRIGGGFVKLLKTDPTRGRFELARLMAQTWAPCELASVHAGEPWSEMLTCLGVNDPSGCTAGNYSEAGWAVSTVVASIVSPPACQIEALNEATTQRCRMINPQFAENETASPQRAVASTQESKQ